MAYQVYKQGRYDNKVKLNMQSSDLILESQL